MDWFWHAIWIYGTIQRPEVPDEYRGQHADREPIPYQTLKSGLIR